jgi:hypothetical protein
MYIYVFVSIYVHICINFFHRCYIWFGAYPNYIHIQMFVKATYVFKEKEKRKEKHQIGTNVRARVFNAGLLPRSQFASGLSCNWPTQSRFSVVFLSPRANAELVS